MYTFLIIIDSIISILLMIIVLMQASKGDGLSGTFGGGGGNISAMFGTRRTADFLSKATWWLGGSLAVLAIIINLIFLPRITNSSTKENIIQNSQQQVPQMPTLPEGNVPQNQTPQPRK